MIFKNTLAFKILYKTFKQKGNLAWEYNPFKNYRLTQAKYKQEDGTLLTEKEANSKGNKIQKYSLVDLNTDEFEYDLEHPVEIQAQQSYDGSVNLYLNDGKHIPRLINSRFSTTGHDTYEIVDRKGDNDTNIYDSDAQFDIDTSLYKRVNNIQKIEFNGTQNNGNLSVGNYYFYFKLSDADGNESDFIGQSGLVSIFIGNSNPHSIQTGTRDQNSHKSVKFTISNIDEAYPYVSVYYSRASAEGNLNIATEYKKIDKLYIVTKAKKSYIQITGSENTIDISENELNQSYNIIDSAKTQAQLGNRLFLGNIYKSTIPYEKLIDLSLQFCPHLSTELYQLQMNEQYNISSIDKGYYDVQNIYNKVGYWPEELYRLGIVYILKSGELSPVFNIRGSLRINENTKYSTYKFDDKKIPHVNYNENTYEVISSDTNRVVEYENVKGVISLDPTYSANLILSINIRFNSETLEEISKYAKGFFFVRQKRIPTILAQGITIGIENESHTPVIPCASGIVDVIKQTSRKDTHVVMNEDSNGKNFVTEGFLSRYSFSFQKKKAGLGGKLLKAFAIGAIVGAMVVASMVTFGGGAVVGGAILATGLMSASAIVTAPLVAVAVAMAASALVTAVTAATLTSLATGVQTISLGIKRLTSNQIYNGWDTECPGGYYVEEKSTSRKLGKSYQERVILKEPTQVSVTGILCPEYTVNQPYFNSIFTGNDHLIEAIDLQSNLDVFLNKRTRHFYQGELDSTEVNTSNISTVTKVVGVPDNTKLITVGNRKFRSRAGEAEEPWKFEYVGLEYLNAPKKKNEKDSEINNMQINSDIIRGSFGPYLGVADDLYNTTQVVNIYTSGYSKSMLDKYLIIRAEDNSPFYAISDRIDIQNIINKSTDIVGVSFDKVVNDSDAYSITVYRGDSYLCQFTQRIIRNFNDPAAPLNDKIVDEDSWKKNYNPADPASYEKINLGDVNAVELGLWCTFKVRSTYNLNIRTIDDSNVDEKALCGHSRGYYPFHNMLTEGTYKIPESQVYNRGFSKSVGDQIHFELPDVPYIKNWFGTRIMYSDLCITDAFRNGYRVFRPTNYRDYTRQYGKITKLIPLGTSLICVMEHGILKLPITPNSNNVTNLNVHNVLPEQPLVISDDYGSQWIDSILKTDYGIYGLDTVAKKIWRVRNDQIEILSEQVVQEFLNRNITLKEREKEVEIGVRNAKTVYNQFKYDVMFTFYNIGEVGETAWNLCFNEKLNKFVTFYSWIPSFMENINNIPFSFNRDISKRTSILYKDPYPLLVSSHYLEYIENSESYLPIRIGWDDYTDGEITMSIPKEEKWTDWVLKKNEGHKPPIEGDPWERSTADEITKYNLYYLHYNGKTEQDTFCIPITIEYKGTVWNSQIRISTKQVEASDYAFWKHGFSGIINTQEKIKPTTWYGEQHPFEYEFIVNDTPRVHKIFDNLEIISNNVAPESFHYEVVGDAYDFAPQKKLMYIRQESAKKVSNKLGNDIYYDKDYADQKVPESEFTSIMGEVAEGIYDRSSILPLYYTRQDHLNSVYDSYKQMSETGSNYDSLSGGEIIHYETLDEYRIQNHSKAVPIPLNNRLRGNMYYKEDKWDVQINPLSIMQKSEAWKDWITDDGVSIPVEYTYSPIPNDTKWPSGDNKHTIWANPKYTEVKMKDKWLKIRVRYKGDKLAIITAIRTLYSISYA